MRKNIYSLSCSNIKYVLN